MYAHHPDVNWAGSVLWLLGMALAGYLVAWFFTDRMGVRRTPYVALLAAVTGGLAAGYVAWSGAGADFWLDRWGWGLLAALVSGLVLALLLRRAVVAPLGHADEKVGTGRFLWEGGLYGVAEGLLLSALPVVVTWQAFSAAGWFEGRRGVAAALSALLASGVLIAVHHLGYRGYRGRRLVMPVVACMVLSVAVLASGSPLAAIGGHVVLHAALLRRHIEMPPETEPRAVAPPELGRALPAH